MPTTRNDLPDNTRKAMVALLNARLADAVDLRLSIRSALEREGADVHRAA